MRKIIKLFIFTILLLNISNTFAEKLIFFYGNWCTHCAKVEKYFNDNNTIKKYKITQKEIYFDVNNRNEFINFWEDFWIPQSKLWVPILFVFDDNWSPNDYKIWVKPIIDYFENIDKNTSNTNIVANPWNLQNKQKTFKEHIAFFSILLPAAISDSINPCEFAVMLILLWSILIKYKKRRKVILSWILFSLAIFISYFLMWIWLYSALWNFKNIFYLKLIIWILWILVWLANLKDFFWYGKFFVMEVPFSWRKNMKNILKWVTSSLWVFVVWFIVSLFLLPCTSWPYLVILWYLSSENHTIDNWWYLYLFIYNLFFILPMLIITFVVAFGKKSIEELELIRDSKIEIIHLIVWILMLLLWTYVLLQAFWIF